MTRVRKPDEIHPKMHVSVHFCYPRIQFVLPRLYLAKGPEKDEGKTGRTSTRVNCTTRKKRNGIGHCHYIQFVRRKHRYTVRKTKSLRGQWDVHIRGRKKNREEMTKTMLKCIICSKSFTRSREIRVYLYIRSLGSPLHAEAMHAIPIKSSSRSLRPKLRQHSSPGKAKQKNDKKKRALSNGNGMNRLTDLVFVIFTRGRRSYISPQAFLDYFFFSFV